MWLKYFCLFYEACSFLFFPKCLNLPTKSLTIFSKLQIYCTTRSPFLFLFFLYFFSQLKVILWTPEITPRAYCNTVCWCVKMILHDENTICKKFLTTTKFCKFFLNFHNFVLVNFLRKPGSQKLVAFAIIQKFFEKFKKIFFLYFRVSKAQIWEVIWRVFD